MIEGHGDDRHNYGPIGADFSSNVPGGIDHSGLYATLSERLASIEHYPEPEPYRLEAALARQLGVDPRTVIATNGATEAIYLAAHLFAGAQSGIVEPTFAEYGDACRLYGHRITELSSPYDPEGIQTLWCCNPNNPTGLTLDRDRLLQTIDNHEDITFLVDHSYASFTLRPVLTAAEAVARGNLVIFNSMTKHYAVPGLRLGYLVAPVGLCERLRRLRMPWSVNALAIEAGLYLLQHGVSGPSTAELLAETRRLADALRATARFEPYPTDTHFMTVEILGPGTAAELKEWLAREHGILIRNAANFRGLGPRHFRIAAQTPAENDRLIEALNRWNPC